MPPIHLDPPPSPVKAARKASLRAALFGETSSTMSFGRYVVLGKLGRGGMGTVLEAFDRSLDRRVAVKVLHRDIAERHTQRLVREAQALARLSHPNVVQVYEVGEVEGQTFIAMELVRGDTLNKWAERRPRPRWQECVEVYLQAGAGLVAAHAEGLVHRDFKPGNAIIDDKGRVRVLDFGLARKAETPEAESLPTAQGSLVPSDERSHDGGALDASLTRTGAIVGTLAYMPLEQMHGGEVDARSDQFSFCVALFEAIHGQRPFEGGSMASLVVALEHERIVAPPGRSPAPARLRQVLRRGLAAEPAARWASMEELLVELRRLVAPRRRIWLALGAVGGLGLLGAGLAYQAGRAEQDVTASPCTGAQAQLEGVWDDERREAVKAAILGTKLAYAAPTWERVGEGLDDYAGAWMRKHTEVCEATNVLREQTAEEMSLRMGCLRKRRAELSATVHVLASADEQVVENAVTMVASLPRQALRCDDVERLVALRGRVPPPKDAAVARAVENLRAKLADIKAEAEAGKHAQAFARVEPVVTEAEESGYMPVVAEALARRGLLHEAEGRYPEAEHDLQRAHALAAEHGNDEVAVESMISLALMMSFRQARNEEAMVWAQAVLPMARRSRDVTILPRALSLLGQVFGGQGKYDQAVTQYREALRITEQALSKEHPLVAQILGDLGVTFQNHGKFAEAEQHHRRVLELRQRTLGEEHPLVAAALHNLGRALVFQGEYEPAVRHFRQALALRERILGAEHPDVAETMTALGSGLLILGEFAEAEQLHRRSLRSFTARLGESNHAVARSLSNLALVFERQGRHEEAAQYHQRALQITIDARGPDHPDVAGYEYNLGNAFNGYLAFDQARPHFERARQIWVRSLGPDHSLLAYALVGLAIADISTGDSGRAREHAERAVSLREHNETAPELLAEARMTLARALWFDRSQRPRAHALALQARDAYAAAGEGEAQFLKHVEQWLATHQLR